MLYSGLVSISFRKLSVEEIIAACVKNRLDAIEWGGDVHVPHGDTVKAEAVAKLMRENGLVTSSYGSYYRAGLPEQPDFAGVVAVARTLGAPTIRVWAGNKASKDASAADWQAVAEDLRRCCGIAAAGGVTVSTEYHCNTLTDTNEAAQKLLALVDHPAMRTGWQPPNGQNFDYRMAGLKAVLDRMTTIHVFHWIEISTRRPLGEGRADWQRYFDVAAKAPGDHYCLLEFAMNDSVEQMGEDAAVLREMLAAANRK